MFCNIHFNALDIVAGCKDAMGHIKYCMAVDLVMSLLHTVTCTKLLLTTARHSCLS